MPVENWNSKRDMTLVNVLERLANHIEQYELRLDEIDKRQHNLYMALEDIRFQQNLWQNATSTTIESLEKNFSRYRSDMLGIVNEQHIIDGSIKEIASRQATIFTAQEDTVRNLSELEGRYIEQEKLVREHSEQSGKRGEVLIRELSEANEYSRKLSAEIKKQLTEDYLQVLKQLESFRGETIDRMESFSGIETMLNELLYRTEPPPPKEPARIVKVYRKTAAAVRSSLVRMCAATAACASFTRKLPKKVLKPFSRLKDKMSNRY